MPPTVPATALHWLLRACAGEHPWDDAMKHLHPHNSFTVSSQPLLCNPTEAWLAQWHWEASDSSLKKYDIRPEERLPSAYTL